MKREMTAAALVVPFVCFLFAVPMALLSAGCGVEGINNANPKTKFRVNPANGQIEYENNKDVDASLKNSSFKDTAGREVKIGELVLRSNASDVRRANGDSQMPGMAMQATASWNGATQFTDSLFNGLAKVMPGLNQLQATKMLAQVPRAQSVPTPWGSLTTSVGLTDQQIQSLMKLAGTGTPGKVEEETKPSQ